ncbi:Molybdopterin oxidoreductase Fe4S4 domain-containing protein [Microbacterium sp. RURRCA19A]|nr:Molybdopterin oxidoreductase Fe4S4 domain-containing protein [Microbacterium sp. RURRCA19A]
MVDRIEHIWGTRTRFARGERWPVRVDTALADGLTEDDIDRWVQSACVLCSNGCATDTAVKSGRMVGVRGRPMDIVNHGRLGPKRLFGSWQGMDNPDRLTRPLIRENGELVEPDWDTAMSRIVERSQHLLHEKGPLTHGFYSSGQLFLEEYYALGIIGEAGLGTPHRDGNTRLCTATAAASMKENFGSDGQPGSYSDIDECDAIFLFGHNMAETQTVLWTRVLDRLAGPNPPRVVCVDPRRTEVARQAEVRWRARSWWNETYTDKVICIRFVSTGRSDGRRHAEVRSAGGDESFEFLSHREERWVGANRPRVVSPGRLLRGGLGSARGLGSAPKVDDVSGLRARLIRPHRYDPAGAGRSHPSWHPHPGLGGRHRLASVRCGDVRSGARGHRHPRQRSEDRDLHAGTNDRRLLSASGPHRLRDSSRRPEGMAAPRREAREADEDRASAPAEHETCPRRVRDPGVSGDEVFRAIQRRARADAEGERIQH